MTKTFIAALAIMAMLPNTSGAILPLKTAQAAPTSNFIPIGIHDTMLNREDVQAKREAEKAEAERKAAEQAKAEREQKKADGKIITVLATAYTHTGNPTATGVMPTAGHTIAVDPRVIPLGTHVLINGVEYIAQDTGGLIKGNRIDIFMDSETECVNFGAQYIEIEVVS